MDHKTMRRTVAQSLPSVPTMREVDQGIAAVIAEIERQGFSVVPSAQVDQKRFADLQAECARLKSDNIAHGGANFLLGIRNAKLSDVHAAAKAVVFHGLECGRDCDEFAASLRALQTAVDAVNEPDSWYHAKRLEVEAERARIASLDRIRAVDIEWTSEQGAAIDAALEQSHGACGSEVARAAE